MYFAAINRMESSIHLSNVITLDQLPEGHKRAGRVGEWHGRVTQRLMEMGVIPGIGVKVIKTGPFGDPIEIRPAWVQPCDAEERSRGDRGELLTQRSIRSMDGAHKSLTIALAGNPNAGKTTLFNSLTGLKQKIANYPGVTVERKEGPWQLNGKAANLIDLPGLYSLEATSLDEQIARQVIVGEQAGIPQPDVIVAVVDATNLERNLYLVTQLFEFGIPVVIALTMMDVFEKQKHQIDVEMLSTLLKVPVIPVTAKDRPRSQRTCEKGAQGDRHKHRIPYDYDESRSELGPARQDLREVQLYFRGRAGLRLA